MAYTFVVFPYLKTTANIRFRELKLRDSEDVAGLPDDAVKHFKILRKLFYLRTYLRIKNMTFVFHEGTIDESTEF